MHETTDQFQFCIPSKQNPGFYKSNTGKSLCYSQGFSLCTLLHVFTTFDSKFTPKNITMNSFDDITKTVLSCIGWLIVFNALGFYGYGIFQAIKQSLSVPPLPVKYLPFLAATVSSVHALLLTNFRAALGISIAWAMYLGGIITMGMPPLLLMELREMNQLFKVKSITRSEPISQKRKLGAIHKCFESSIGIQVASLVLILLCSTTICAQIEVKLGGEKIILRRVANETALVYDSNDTTIVTELMKHGIFLDKKLKQQSVDTSNQYALFTLSGAEKRKFNRTIRGFNDRSLKDVDTAPVYEYDRSLNVLTDEFIIKFKDEISSETINHFMATNNLEFITPEEDIRNQFIVRFTDINPEEALKKLSSYDTAFVSFIEPNFIRIIKTRPFAGSYGGGFFQAQGFSADNPNDSLLNAQWYLQNNGTRGKRDADIKGVLGWSISKGSEGVIIAVLDEGVDTKHRDLKPKIVNPYDAVENDFNQDPQPKAGHGTACAGIAAATTNNVSGISGIGWNCKIMPVRIAEIDGNNYWITTSRIIARGIRMAAVQGAQVLSCSWTAGLPSNAVNDAIDFAIGKNCIMVFAAGNENGSVSYPARLSTIKNIIAVAATNEWDEPKSPTSQDGEPWGSNFGPEITVSAPGVHICTTDISGPGRGYDENAEYIFDFNGTSSATPMVAGAMAMLLSIKPDIKPAEAIRILKNNADDLGSNGFDERFGYGRLNILKLLSAIR